MCKQLPLPSREETQMLLQRAILLSIFLQRKRTDTNNAYASSDKIKLQGSYLIPSKYSTTFKLETCAFVCVLRDANCGIMGMAGMDN